MDDPQRTMHLAGLAESVTVTRHQTILGCNASESGASKDIVAREILPIEWTQTFGTTLTFAQ